MVPLAIAGPASAEVRMAAVPRIARLSFVMGRSLFVICDFHNERRDTDVPASFLRIEPNVRIIPEGALLQTPPLGDEAACRNEFQPDVVNVHFVEDQ
jgi:hypothetical protein